MPQPGQADLVLGTRSAHHLTTPPAVMLPTREDPWLDLLQATVADITFVVVYPSVVGSTGGGGAPPVSEEGGHVFSFPVWECQFGLFIKA